MGARASQTGAAYQSTMVSDSARSSSSHSGNLWLTALAAFCAYFCMYAFRKPFTAATYDGITAFGMDLKSTLVLSQLLGYTLSKFIGIKVISETRATRRAATILTLIGISQSALIGFAVLPVAWKVPMIFLNGLPLGMVFGLILAYLEGRKQTEALSAALCASFIISSGVVKWVGRGLLGWGVSEFAMPMVTGFLFVVPLLLSVWLLQITPPPTAEDQVLRSTRQAMTKDDRRRWVLAYWPGLTLLILVYVVLTIIRTIRDDFAVEIWRDMGIENTPSVFATSEALVGVLVTAACAFTIWIRHNLLAIRVTLVFMGIAFSLSLGSVFFQRMGWISPYGFMVICGIGLYFPYVAFHTTVFERLIAAARMPGNLGFLMYLADSIGYLGYAVIIVTRSQIKYEIPLLLFFHWTLVTAAAIAIACLIGTWIYFSRKLKPQPEIPANPSQPEAPVIDRTLVSSQATLKHSES